MKLLPRICFQAQILVVQFAMSSSMFLVYMPAMEREPKNVSVKQRCRSTLSSGRS